MGKPAEQDNASAFVKTPEYIFRDEFKPRTLLEWLNLKFMGLYPELEPHQFFIDKPTREELGLLNDFQKQTLSVEAAKVPFVYSVMRILHENGDLKNEQIVEFLVSYIEVEWGVESYEKIDIYEHVPLETVEKVFRSTMPFLKKHLLVAHKHDANDLVLSARGVMLVEFLFDNPIITESEACVPTTKLGRFRSFLVGKIRGKNHGKTRVNDG